MREINVISLNNKPMILFINFRLKLKWGNSVSSVNQVRCIFTDLGSQGGGLLLPFSGKQIDDYKMNHWSMTGAGQSVGYTYENFWVGHWKSLYNKTDLKDQEVK